MKRKLVLLVALLLTSAVAHAQAPNIFYGKMTIVGGPLIVAPLQAPSPITVVYTGRTHNVGLFCYIVTAKTNGIESSVSTEYCVSNARTTLDKDNNVSVSWGAVPGADSYNVYGRTTGAELLMASCPNGTGCQGPLAFNDIGSLTPAGALPSTNATGGVSAAGAMNANGGYNQNNTPFASSLGCVNHLATGTTPALACTPTAVCDLYTETLAAATTTPALPTAAAATACGGTSTIYFWATQTASTSDSVGNFTAGAGATVTYDTNGGTLLQIAQNPGSAAQSLYQAKWDPINSIWHIVGQVTNPSQNNPPAAGTCAAGQYETADNSGSGPTCAPVSSLDLQDGPPWMHYFGDGSEADPAVFANTSCTAAGLPVACCTGSGTGTCTSSQTLQGIHYYANFTVGVGATATLGTTGVSNSSPGVSNNPPVGGLIVYSPGICNVAGTITGASKGSAAGANGMFGSGGGGGGWGAAIGSPGGPGSIYGANGPSASNQAVAASGAAAASGGVSGGAGAAPTTQGIQSLVQSPPSVGACGGGGGGAGGSSGGAGGAGGGCVYLICNSINFTGTITVAGATGGAGGSSTGGGGGGGGGAIVTAARSYTVNTGTRTITAGGAGAIGTGTSTAGGLGGVGWSKQFTLN